MAGTNDLKRRSAAEIASSLEQLHATCHAAGTRTLALGIPHSKASTVGSRVRSERRREVNAACGCVAYAEGVAHSGYSYYGHTGERVAACVRCAQRGLVRLLRARQGGDAVGGGLKLLRGRRAAPDAQRLRPPRAAAAAGAHAPRLPDEAQGPRGRDLDLAARDQSARDLTAGDRDLTAGDHRCRGGAAAADAGVDGAVPRGRGRRAGPGLRRPDGQGVERGARGAAPRAAGVQPCSSTRL